MEDGAELSRSEVSSALKSKGLKLKTFEQQDIAVPKSGYELSVTGTT